MSALDTIIFKNTTLFPEFGFYPTTDRICLLYRDVDGLPMLKASINLPNTPIPTNHIAVKDFGECAGLYQTLIDFSIIEPADIKVYFPETPNIVVPVSLLIDPPEMLP